MDTPARRRCPICQGPVADPPGNATFPFCSSRCKVIDLGNWLDGAYAIPAVEDDGADDAPAPPAGPTNRTVH